MEVEPAYWLAINRLPSLRHAERAALLDASASPGDILAARARVDWHGVERDLAWLEHPDRHLLTFATAGFPAPLRHIADPPPVLFVEGDPGVLAAPQVAIVGSRRATPCGMQTAYALSESLAGCGLAITSGLALGVDGASHRGAIAARGTTLAVAANGLDSVYPRRHRRLARAVVESGALVSEFAPGTPPLAAHFPRRNRLISGLALGVVVVEAARRSGSLITARLAAEQGREVFAVPGPVQSPLSRGCHHLIREGAKLVEQVSDILEELPDGPWRLVGPEAPATPDRLLDGLDAREKNVLHCVAYGATSVDCVVERSGLTADMVCSILLALEIRGLVVPVPGGAYCRVTNRPDSG